MEYADATVMILSEDPALTIRGRLFGFPGSAITLLVPNEIPYGAAVRIETADTLLLGEACGSTPEPAGFRIKVDVAHQLTSLSDLSRLNRAILGFDGRRARPESEDAVTVRRGETTSF